MQVTKYNLFDIPIDATHTLIGGSTGSGKSVIINGIINNILITRTPKQARLVLIDPKRIELVLFRKVPHTLMYASEPGNIVDTLKTCLDMCDARYGRMQLSGIKECQESHVYLIIDELADISINPQIKKEVLNTLIRLAQIGRAANIHIIAATQNLLAKVIPTELKVNFTTIIGLHTRSKTDSRVILGYPGCELLPMYGQAYILEPGKDINLYPVPMYTQSEIDLSIDHWLTELEKARPKKKMNWLKRILVI